MAPEKNFTFGGTTIHGTLSHKSEKDATVVETDTTKVSGVETKRGAEAGKDAITDESKK